MQHHDIYNILYYYIYFIKYINIFEDFKYLNNIKSLIPNELEFNSNFESNHLFLNLDDINWVIDFNSNTVKLVNNLNENYSLPFYDIKECFNFVKYDIEKVLEKKGKDKEIANIVDYLLY